MERLARLIAGEIVVSPDPGATMRKWREIFGVSQAQLAAALRISPSTISDYEANRRASPGIKVVRRFIDALLRIDAERGGQTAAKFALAIEDETAPYEVHDFSTAMSARDFTKLIAGTVLAGADVLDKKRVYGWTLLDSIKVILEFTYTDFQKLYGAISERAFIFTQVSTGRSPMIAVKLAPIKPAVVAIHGLKRREVDELAIKIAEKERIPLIHTEIDVGKIKETLMKY